MTNISEQTLEMIEKLQANGKRLEKEMAKQEKLLNKIDKSFKRILGKWLTLNQ